MVNQEEDTFLRLIMREKNFQAILLSLALLAALMNNMEPSGVAGLMPPSKGLRTKQHSMELGLESKEEVQIMLN